MNNNDKVILENRKEIEERYIQLKKLAYSYWDFFAFSFGYCITYPILHKYSKIKPRYNIIASMFLSYIFYKNTLKYYTKTFNNTEYTRYKTFCLKYGLEEELIF